MILKTAQTFFYQVWKSLLNELIIFLKASVIYYNQPDLSYDNMKYVV